MKLKQISAKEPVVRLSISVKKSTSDMISAYRELYERQYGHSIDLSPFIDTIVKEFISADRDFMKVFSANQAKAEQEAREEALSEFGQTSDDESDDAEDAPAYAEVDDSEEADTEDLGTAAPTSGGLTYGSYARN